VGVRQVFGHTHLVRGGHVMLQPKGARPRLGLLHTHLVRGGSMMLRPTILDGADQTGTPAKATASITHLSRGGYARLGHSFVGFTITDPSLTRWVCAKI